MLLLVTTLSLTITACGGGDNDEPDNPYIPDTPNTPNEPDEPAEDSHKYDIVGIWECYYYWKYSGITEHITFDIKSNGTLSYSDTDDNGGTPDYGSGTWSYQNNSWSISTNSTLTSGTYVMVNNQLIFHQDFADGSSRTVIFNRVNDNNQPNETDYKSILLKHKTWSWYNSQYDNGFFTFSGTRDVQFLQSGNKKVGSYGIPILDARGTFEISGNTLDCIYLDVMIDPTSASDQFPGWNIGHTRRIVYTIEKLTDDELILKEGTTKLILKP